MFPQEWPDHGIECEMRIRANFQTDRDIRLSHADSAREKFWLKKIEANMDGGSVLVICGYLHVNFLAQKVEERGGADDRGGQADGSRPEGRECGPRGWGERAHDLCLEVEVR